MPRNEKLKLTSVHILTDFKDDIATDNIITKMSLQKIFNRCLHLYLTDDDFKNKILSHTDLIMSGSL